MMGKPSSSSIAPAPSAPISFVQLPKHPGAAYFSSPAKVIGARKLSICIVSGHTNSHTDHFICGRGKKEATLLQYVSEETRAPTYGGDLTWPLATPPPAAGELERGRETVYQLSPPTTPAPQQVQEKKNRLYFSAAQPHKSSPSHPISPMLRRSRRKI